MSRLLLAEDPPIEPRGPLSSMRMKVRSGHVQTIRSWSARRAAIMSDDSNGNAGSRVSPRGRMGGPRRLPPRRGVDRTASMAVRGVKHEPRSQRATL